MTMGTRGPHSNMTMGTRGPHSWGFQFSYDTGFAIVFALRYIAHTRISLDVDVSCKWCSFA